MALQPLRYEIKASDQTGDAFKSFEGNVKRAETSLVVLNAETMAVTRENRILTASNANLAGSAAFGAVKLGLLAASLGVISGGRIGKAIRAIGVLKVGMFAAAAAAVALTAVAIKAVPAFADWEREMLTLKGVVKATGGAAGRTAEDIDKLEHSISTTTLATGTMVKEAAAQLLTFRSVAEETFDRALIAAQDLAAVGFGSVSSSAVQIGKALEDPIKGISALRRVGVSFTVTQREMIKNFVETGQVGKAQSVILAGIEAQVGGAGAAQASGLTGAFHLLSEATGEWFEIVGQGVAKITRLNSVLRSLASAIFGVNDAMSAALEPVTGRSLAVDRLTALQAELANAQGSAKLLGKIGFGEFAQGELAKIDQAVAGAQTLVNEFEAFDRLLLKIKHDTSVSIQKELKKPELIVDKDAVKQAAAIKALLGDLELERKLIGATATQQRIMNTLRSAGVELMSKEGQAIATLIEGNMRLATAYDAAKEQAEFFDQVAFDGISNLIAGVGTLEDALRGMIAQLAEAALQAALLGTGPLATIFGGGTGGGTSSGFIGSVLGSLFGGVRAHGGPVSPGKAFLVGERGPELFMPNTSGSIVPGGGGQASRVVIVIEEGGMFAPRVKEISGNVSVEVSGAMIGANEARRSRSELTGAG